MSDRGLTPRRSGTPPGTEGPRPPRSPRGRSPRSRPSPRVRAPRTTRRELERRGDLDAVHDVAGTRPGHVRGRRQSHVVDGDRLGPGVAELLDHRDEGLRAERAGRVRHRDGHARTAGRDGAGEDALGDRELGGGGRRDLPGVRGALQLVELSLQAVALVGELEVATVEIVQEPDEVVLTQARERVLLVVAHLGDQGDAEQRAERGDEDL